jgi:hypothetical protein
MTVMPSLEDAEGLEVSECGRDVRTLNAPPD